MCIRDSAYPGYWSDTAAHAEFFEKLWDGDNGPEDFNPAKIEIGTQLPWVAGIDSFAKIQKLTHPATDCKADPSKCGIDSKLRVMETIYLAERKGLEKASHDAIQFLCPESQHFSKPGTSGDTFAAMIDIKNARSFVTPLPIY